MNVLFLAPEPFYQGRGTPIAVDRLLRVLSEQGHTVDLVTYHEGTDVTYPGLTLHRIPSLPFLRNIQPGFSLKKVLCDVLLFGKALKLAWRGRYQIVHAVEEAAFVGLVLKVLFGLPYVYDMDSELSEQVVTRHRWLQPLLPAMNFVEGQAARQAKAVVPVCGALARGVAKYDVGRVLVLQDPTLLLAEGPEAPVEDLRAQLGITGPIVLYVGNLKTYQGIDLLLESFALVRQATAQASLVIIGGEPTDLDWYQRRSRRLGLNGAVHFVGPRPIENLGAYLAQADILVSPRIQGTNTPMKVYSYLDSGKPLLATNLATHTQVLDESVALLAEPSPEPFAQAMLRLLGSATLRDRLGRAGRRLVEANFTYQVFRRKLAGLYEWLEEETAPSPQRSDAA